MKKVFRNLCEDQRAGLKHDENTMKILTENVQLTYGIRVLNLAIEVRYQSTISWDKSHTGNVQTDS